MKKRILTVIMAFILSILSVMPVFAEKDIPKERQQPRLVDKAELLTDEEESELLSKLDEISERQKCDVAVVTVKSLEGKTATEYADDFYDYNGYGIGKDRDGILLLVGMEDRAWAISTCGYGITAFTDAGLEYIEEEFKPSLSDGDYSGAFICYADQCDDFITQAKTGEPYDVDNLPVGEIGIVEFMISLAIGAIIALICVTVMKSKLKSVVNETAAANYVKRGSLKITDKKDLFLYKKLDKREKPKDEDNGGGSSTHTSSSGSSHGGSSGSF